MINYFRGDVTKLQIINANLVWIANAELGANVDILMEQ